MTASDTDQDSFAFAVVGFALRFPGAPDADAFWNLLVDERSGLSTVRPAPGRIPVAGLLNHQLEFDPEPFGIGESEALRLDPQQRVFLECSWHALEHAGYCVEDRTGSTGVFAGAANSHHLWRAFPDFDPAGGADPARNLDLHTSHIADYLPLRVAHRLGTTGPALSVGATCATSLVAVHIACQSLVTGECDLALAGGVSLRIPQDSGYVAVPDGPFSADGAIRPYSSSASGTVFTQGCGVVVLRRLADALADGDHVHAVVRGSAVTNDGSDRMGFTAPSEMGQARAIAQALSVAGLQPRDIGYVEGHGTGTVLGDPIEVAALRRVFGPADAPWCALGSVKSSIGHADSAAGIAGFLKAVLSVRNGIIPASLHATPENPALELAGSAFALADCTREWTSDAPRRAGVSAFGFGGVNCHVIVEQPPEPAPTATGDRRGLLLVSGASREAADQTADAILDHVRRHPETLAAAAHTLRVGRRTFPHRVAVTVDGADTSRVSAHAGTRARTVFVFPGGGTAITGTCRELYGGETVFARELDRIADLLRPVLDWDVRELLLAETARSPQQETTPRYGLPAAFAASIATARTLAEHGLEPDAVVGHSLGEYAAAVVAGMLDDEDAATLVALRSIGMTDVGEGAMLALPLSHDETDELLSSWPGIEIAAVNGPRAVTVAGPHHAVGSLRAALRDRGVRAVPLGITVAAHTAMIEPVVPTLDAAARNTVVRTGHTPLFSTLTGALADAHELARDGRWGEHLRRPVRFDRALNGATAGAESTVVVQVGHGSALLRAARQSNPAAMTIATLATGDGGGPVKPGDLLDAVGRAWVSGAALRDAPADARFRRIPLPGYRFQRRHFDATARPSYSPPSRFRLPMWDQTPLVALDPEASTADAACVVVAEPGTATRLRDHLYRRFATVDLVDPLASVEDIAQVLAPHDEVCVVASTAPGADVPAQDVPRLVHDAMTCLGRFGEAARRNVTALHWVAVATGAEEVLPGDTVHPVVAALHALPRVLAQESDRISWRTVDVDASLDVRALTAVIADEAADLAGGGRSAEEIAIRTASGSRLHRWRRSWTPWNPADTKAAPPRVVVVSGGVGNLGIALAHACAVDAPGCTVVLTSRRGRDGLDVERQQRLDDAERSLTESGGRLEVHRVDATDRIAVAGLLDDITSRTGRIDLVVHAPAVVELATLAEDDRDVTGRVMDPKCLAAHTLISAVDALSPTVRPLVAILMSSVGGTIGGAGLGAYVAASRYLDALPHVPLPDGTAWFTVDSDRLRTGTDAEALSSAEVSMRHAIDVTDAAHSLLELRASATANAVPPRIVMSATDPGARVRDSAGRSTRNVRRSAASRTATELSSTEQVVADAWSRALGVTVDARDDDFFELGGHSLLATRVLRDLEPITFGTIRLRDLLSAPTVAALARSIDDTGGLVENSVPASPADPVAAATATGSEPLRFPSTWVQHAYRVGRQADRAQGGGVGCHFYLEHLANDFDPTRYENAWNTVIERHPMLRAVVDTDGYNRILPSVPRYRLPVRDVRSLPSDAQTEALAAFRERLDHRVADPAVWPLLGPHVLRCDDGWHIGISVDVLVCDSASYLVLDAEVRAFYENPDAELAPPGTTFEACIRAVESRSGTADYERARAYWTERAAELPSAPDLPAPQAPVSAPADRRFRRLATRVDAATWRAATERAARESVTPTALLLWCYGTVLARWSGDDHFSVTVTVFDRPPIHPDADRVVGEFSSLIVHEMDLRDDPAPDEARRRITDRLFDDLDHVLYPGPAVLADRARARGHTENVPVVFTGMLGLERAAGVPGDRNVHDTEWLGPIVHGVSQTPQVWLDHQAYEHDGDLVLQWDVDIDRIDPADATVWFERYADSIRATATVPDVEAHSASGPEVNSVLARIWAQLLDVDTDTLTDGTTFLAAGGDSLLAVRMASMVREELGVVLRLPEVRTDVRFGELTRTVTDRAAGRTRVPAVAVTRRADPAASVPLPPLAQAYFVGRHDGWELSYPSVHYFTDAALRGMDEQIAVDELEDALDRLVAHQAGLRMAVTPEGRQYVRDLDDPDARIDFAVDDLRGMTPAARAAWIDELRRTLSVHGPDPAEGPGTAVRLVLLGEGHGRLMCTFSLLTVDGWSAALFERELLTMLGNPNALLAPLTVDAADYAAALAELATTSEHDDDRQWWISRIPTLPAAPDLPTVADPNAVDVTVMAGLTRQLDGAAHARLRALCSTHEVSTTVAVLAAYAIALAGIAGHRRFLLTTLEAHRHPLHPDIERLIGAFSSTTVLDIDLQRSSFAQIADTVRREFDSALAHDLFSGVEVLRELTRHRRTHGHTAAEAPSPVVFQSTLGLAGALGPRPVDAGPLGTVDHHDVHHRIRTPQVRCELRAYEIDDALVLDLAYVAEVFSDDTAHTLLDRVEAIVRSLCDPSGWDTVHELPDVRDRPPIPDVAEGIPGESDSTLTGSADPRAELVADIATWWSDEWGLSVPVTPQSDFLACGADSLALVRMTAQLRERYSVAVDLTSIIAASTPFRVAAEITSAIPVVDLGGTNDADAPVLVLIHPSGGDVSCYGELAAAVSGAGRIVAIPDDGTRAVWNGPDGITGVARRYADAIAAVVGDTACVVAGWSMGGILAHETARLLTERDVQVSSIALIDANLPDRIVLTPDDSGCEQMYSASIAAFVGIDVAALRGDAHTTLVRRRAEVFGHHIRALARHRAAGLPGHVPVVVVRATRNAPANSGIGMGVDDARDLPALGWAAHCGPDLRVVDLDTHHYRLLTAPHVATVADLLDDLLDGASVPAPSTEGSLP